jgi:hypothetical protein
LVPHRFQSIDRDTTSRNTMNRNGFVLMAHICSQFLF